MFTVLINTSYTCKVFEYLSYNWGHLIFLHVFHVNQDNGLLHHPSLFYFELAVIASTESRRHNSQKYRGVLQTGYHIGEDGLTRGKVFVSETYQVPIMDVGNSL